jgi:hypothetical protein
MSFWQIATRGVMLLAISTAISTAVEGQNFPGGPWYDFASRAKVTPSGVVVYDAPRLDEDTMRIAKWISNLQIDQNPVAPQPKRLLGLPDLTAQSGYFNAYGVDRRRLPDNYLDDETKRILRSLRDPDIGFDRIVPLAERLMGLPDSSARRGVLLP